MPDKNAVPSDLMQLAASQAAGYLSEVSVGSPLPLDSSADLFDTLELLLPEILRRRHPEWASESLDGFTIASAVKVDEMSAEIVGTAILMSDQAVTPFELYVLVTESGAFRGLRIRMGEAGGGPLGISGPVWGSRAARAMLMAIKPRVVSVDWIYDVAIEK